MVQLLFPCNLRINVPAGDRIEMFTPGSGKNVVYAVGKDSQSIVNFVLKEAAIKAYPDSLFALQLTRITDFHSGVMTDGDDISIRIDKHDALYFPIVFAYLNSGVSSTANGSILSAGLSTSDAKAVIELTHQYFQINPDRATIVHHLKLQHGFNTQRVTLRASGMLSQHQVINTVIARIDSNGIIHAAGGDAEVQINLNMVPIAAPWPRSVVGNKVMEMLLAGRQYARRKEAEASPLPIILGDEFGPVPDNDDDLLPYPYPVDMKESFFIPAAAIRYKGSGVRYSHSLPGARDTKTVVIEGMVDGYTMRLDAVNDPWFWLEIGISID